MTKNQLVTLLGLLAFASRVVDVVAEKENPFRHAPINQGSPFPYSACFRDRSNATVTIASQEQKFLADALAMVAKCEVDRAEPLACKAASYEGSYLYYGEGLFLDNRTRLGVSMFDCEPSDNGDKWECEKPSKCVTDAVADATPKGFGTTGDDSVLVWALIAPVIMALNMCIGGYMQSRIVSSSPSPCFSLFGLFAKSFNPLFGFFQERGTPEENIPFANKA